MRKRICEKLRSRTGESIAETLIAVLVIAVAAMLLAGMISATNNMVRQSNDKMNEYYKENAKLEIIAKTTTSTDTIQISAKVVNETSDIAFSIPGVPVTYVENTTFGSNPVIAYR